MTELLITGTITAVVCMTIILGLLCAGLRLAAEQERIATEARRNLAV